jgi:hypothetical protein
VSHDQRLDRYLLETDVTRVRQSAQAILNTDPGDLQAIVKHANWMFGGVAAIRAYLRRHPPEDAADG